MNTVADNVFLVEDTCNVYVVRQGDSAVLIDFGSGAALDLLPSIGVRSVSAILMTHHHRDQGQGLYRALAAGIPIYVPHTERELFDEADAHWQSRPIRNNYNVRQDRFTTLRSVPVTGTLKDYEIFTAGALAFRVLPTPGHTTGSITLLLDEGGRNIGFCGDLIAMPGKVWSLAATQWTYGGAEGVYYSLLSLLDLLERDLSLLLPSHGRPMAEPAAAMTLLIDHFHELLKVRDPIGSGNVSPSPAQSLFGLYDKPFEQLSPHLLINRTSQAQSYVLLSDSGKALLIDYGYDFNPLWLAAGADRASRRPWLYNLKKLKLDYGVSRIDVVLPTHHHDDHVAGFNLLRDVEGTQVWAPGNFADLLERPQRYDLPCTWYDPIPVDRVLPLEQEFRWEEYAFTLYELPGHSLYAVAIAFEADGRKVLAIGDQQGNNAFLWNYVYQNGFRYGDYIRSAELYARLKPDLMISGHWAPVRVDEAHLAELADKGAALDAVHHRLLPTDWLDFEAGGFAAVIYPYYAICRAGETLIFTAVIRNPLAVEAEAVVAAVVPEGWAADGDVRLRMDAHTYADVSFAVRVPPEARAFRERVAVDVTVGDIRLGQQAEALITVH